MEYPIYYKILGFFCVTCQTPKSKCFRRFHFLCQKLHFQLSKWLSNFFMERISTLDFSWISYWRSLTSVDFPWHFNSSWCRVFQMKPRKSPKTDFIQWKLLHCMSLSSSESKSRNNLWKIVYLSLTIFSFIMWNFFRKYLLCIWSAMWSDDQVVKICTTYLSAVEEQENNWILGPTPERKAIMTSVT